ncbi:hypothetical protein Q4E93_13070 [Flavitalea sp. BT771]|nr:hypothetical protein [Flavitalea sp. BT771]MDO6431529.1 hypothetical protein [Flavitalea sp. BT771]MDV6220437.1 hypothetical protein [Flavitalea sp. BT771]
MQITLPKDHLRNLTIIFTLSIESYRQETNGFIYKYIFLYNRSILV